MLLFASGNRGKCGEAKELALECGVSLVSPFDLTASFCEQQGLPVPKGAPPQVDETGRTYEENAHLKAQAYFDWSGIPSVADDSGLEVVALGGEPGLYTARYAGEGCSPDENIQKLLMVLEGEQNRRALFICVLCLVGFDSPMFIRGELDGEIALKKEEGLGFGYDPIFYLPQFGHTLSYLKGEGIDVPTHRRKALKQLFTLLS